MAETSFHARPADARTAPRAVAIQLTADADPDSLARIANVVRLANVPPWRVLLYTVGFEVRVEIELREVEDSVIERIHRKLMQLSCVDTVEMRANEGPSIGR